VRLVATSSRTVPRKWLKKDKKNTYLLLAVCLVAAMPSSNFASYLLASLSASSSVLLMALSGVWATRTKRLSPETIKQLAIIGKDLLLPALLVAQVPSSGLNLSTLGIFWILPAACTFYVLLGVALSRAISMLAGVPLKTSNLVVACASFPTSTGPILALFGATLTALNENTKETDMALGASAILIYTAFMNIYRWTVGWSLMAPPQEAMRAATEGATDDDALAHFASPAVALAPPEDIQKSRFSHIKCKELMEPPVVAAFVAVSLALCTPIHSIFYDEDAPLRAVFVGTLNKLGEAYVASTLLILGSQLAYGPSSRANTEMKGLMVVIFVRLLLVPAVTLVIGSLLDAHSVWWRDSVPFGLKLVVLLESAGPPAIANGSMAKLRGFNEAEVANMLFWTYLLGTFFIVGWLGAFIEISR
jgi:predicted permease